MNSVCVCARLNACLRMNMCVGMCVSAPLGLLYLRAKAQKLLKALMFFRVKRSQESLP
uniref:Uncharacterized protein n=1 Tax=Anguilla anguilla TaxID=7936 RepID=A0A0E9W6Y7_ANGAN